MKFLGVNESSLTEEQQKELKEITQKILKEALEMKCPKCGKNLIIGEGTKRYQTLEEHVMSPNDEVSRKPYFICPDVNCSLFHNSFWDFQGSFYSNLTIEEQIKIFGVTGNEIFNHTNPKACFEAMNSFSRKSWMEVYYKEETKTVFLGKFGARIKYKITSNFNGEIIKRTPKIEWFIKEKDGMVVYHIWGIHMFFYSLRKCKKYVIEVNKNGKESYAYRSLKNCLDKSYFTNKKDWWRVLSCFINNLLWGSLLN